MEADKTLKEFAEDVARPFGYRGTTPDGRAAYTAGGLSTLEWAWSLLGWPDPKPAPECECQEEDCHEWVSVYDRLPEPGERVLATDCGFVGEFYINKRGKWQRYNVNCSELLMALDILYWMPLPKSPKEDE